MISKYRASPSRDACGNRVFPLGVTHNDRRTLAKSSRALMTSAVPLRHPHKRARNSVTASLPQLAASSSMMIVGMPRWIAESSFCRFPRTLPRAAARRDRDDRQPQPDIRPLLFTPRTLATMSAIVDAPVRRCRRQATGISACMIDRRRDHASSSDQSFCPARMPHVGLIDVSTSSWNAVLPSFVQDR